jgi:hypothetical protein
VHLGPIDGEAAHAVVMFSREQGKFAVHMADDYMTTTF